MPVIPIAALVVSAAGAYMSYDAAQEQAKATKATAAYNAKVQENEAIQADMEAREEIARTRRQNKRLLAEQRASVAGSGVAMAGSPLEVLGDNAAMYELNALDQARAATAGVLQGKSAAKATRWQGDMEAKGIRRSANAQLVSDTGRLAGQYYNYSQAGAFKAGKN